MFNQIRKCMNTNVRKECMKYLNSNYKKYQIQLNEHSY